MRSVNLIWENDKTLLINDVRFFVTFDSNQLHTVESSENLFLLGKSRKLIDGAVAIGQQQKVSRVFDIGIFKGGSVVLYDQIYQPEKIIAIEYKKQPVKALTKYIDNRKKHESIKPFYGVDQADRLAMGKILVDEFPERNIDLVVDDASHFYKQTKEAFNITFPYLKAGGQYVIEDWAWAHWPGDIWQKNQWKDIWRRSFYRKQKALSNLLIELFMLAASRGDLIENISINDSVIVVKKGNGIIPEGRFNIEDHYLLRGKSFGAWL